MKCYGVNVFKPFVVRNSVVTINTLSFENIETRF